MEKAPTLKELLSNRKESHANLIIVSTIKDKDLFKGDVSELPEELLNISIFAWDKRDGIYITIE
jgi:hypothetical protein